MGILHPESQVKYNAISFHPSEKMAGVVLGHKSIAAYDFDGNIINKQTGAYENVFYSREGEFIWTIEKLEEGYLCTSVLDSMGMVLAQHEMEEE